MHVRPGFSLRSCSSALLMERVGLVIRSTELWRYLYSRADNVRACAHTSHVNRNKYSTPFLFRLAFACFFFFFFHLQNSIENTFCLYSTSFFLTFVSICLNRIGRWTTKTSEKRTSFAWLLLLLLFFVLILFGLMVFTFV